MTAELPLTALRRRETSRSNHGVQVQDAGGSGDADSSRQVIEDGQPCAEMFELNKLIIVSGPPRSGTTLVQNILDSHPEVGGSPEFLHLQNVVELRKVLHGSIDKGYIDCFFDKARADEYLRALIVSMFSGMAERLGKPWFSEKSPSNALVLDALTELLPESKFIFVVRDPRAVVSSLLNVGKRADKGQWSHSPWLFDTEAAIDWVRRHLEVGFATAAKRPERIHLVKYESLVTDPQPVIRAMCEYLALPWSDQMLDPAAKHHAGADVLVSTPFYDSKDFHRGIDVASLGKWRELLSGYQQYRVCRAFQDHPGLNEMGYTDLSPVRGNTFSIGVARGAGAARKFWRRHLKRRLLG